jgi:hypothetical protein
LIEVCTVRAAAAASRLGGHRRHAAIRRIDEQRAALLAVDDGVGRPRIEPEVL